MSLRFAIAAFLLVGLCRMAVGQDHPPSQLQAAEIDELIKQLGSDQFLHREAAAEQLAALGSAALPAIERAAGHPNREIRFRSQRIIQTIRQRDDESRLEAFLKGGPGAASVTLPGWTRFRDRYGDSAQTRSFFVSMHRAESDLLAALDVSSRQAAELLVRQVTRDHQMLQLGGQNLPLGQVAATLFVAGEPDITVPAPTMDALYSHCYQPAFAQALGGGEQMALTRRIVGQVILRGEDRSAMQAMHVASRFHLPEGVVAAKRILERQGPFIATSMTQVALMTIAQLGDESHLPLVEKLLQCEDELSKMQDQTATYVVQVRDVALAAAVMLSKQEMKAYFHVPPQVPGELQFLFFDPHVVGFARDEDRAKAFAQWARYKAGKSPGR